MKGKINTETNNERNKDRRQGIKEKGETIKVKRCCFACHEGVRKTRGITPLILNLSNRYQRVLIVTPRLTGPREVRLSTRYMKGGVGTRDGKEAMEKIKLARSCRKSKHNSSAVQPQPDHYAKHATPADDRETPEQKKPRRKEAFCLPYSFILNPEHILRIVLMCARKRYDCNSQISGNCELFFS